MAGCKIVPTGIIKFANGSISTGKTAAILTTLTQTSSATPSAGDKMFWDNGTNDYAFKVLGGTYSNTYVINRNDSRGEQIWGSAYGSGGKMSMDDFHSYQHWPPDQRLAFSITNNHPDDHNVDLKIVGGTTILSYSSPGTSGLYDPWSGAINNYNIAPGSSGPYDPGAPNTGWTIQVIVSNTTQTMPSNVNIDASDYHTRAPIYSATTPLHPGVSWFFSDTWVQRYYSVFNYIVDIS